MLDIPVLLELGERIPGSAVVISGQHAFPFIAVENPQIEAWREGRQLPPITINVGLASQQIVQEGFWLPAPFTPPSLPLPQKLKAKKSTKINSYVLVALTCVHRDYEASKMTNMISWHHMLCRDRKLMNNKLKWCFSMTIDLSLWSVWD